jgi:glycosyltransferase involved in cell wall biosynthesis
VEDERDYQYAMTNLTSALAADAVWFNSQFHRKSFLDALAKFLKSMPDYQPLEVIEKIREKASIHYPGVVDFPAKSKRKSGAMRILWAARWEHDKNPEDFFEALEILKNKNVEFKISVIGQSFRDVPEIFKNAKENFKDNIEHWGYQETRQEYENILSEADVVVSTANHEFFGISIVEAVAAGAYPLVPNCLSYPEILDIDQNENAKEFFYNRTVNDLADKLEVLSERLQEDNLLIDSISPEKITSRFKWKTLAPQYDKAFEEICRDNN